MYKYHNELAGYISQTTMCFFMYVYVCVVYGMSVHMSVF